MMRDLLRLLLPLLLTACLAPQVIETKRTSARPQLGADHVQSSDGYRLPLRIWPPGDRDGLQESEPARGPQPNLPVVVLGLHGFNDYSRAFSPLAQSLADAGAQTYAVDQRGFGAARQRGRWHGSRRLTEDLRTLVALLRKRHPEARLVLIGESMGGAVALAALAEGALPVDGIVLIAPAVWSRDAMPWYQRVALDTMAYLAPGIRLTGEGVKIRPSDNIDMLKEMSSDPLVVKATRVDALWGVTNLMDRAIDGIDRLGSVNYPILLLYGERDEIIPRHAFCRVRSRLADGDSRLRLVLYETGWHMLPRDLQGRRVHQDIVAWLRDPTGSLPSGEETAVDGARLRHFCATASPMAR